MIYNKLKNNVTYKNKNLLDLKNLIVCIFVMQNGKGLRNMIIRFNSRQNWLLLSFALLLCVAEMKGAASETVDNYRKQAPIPEKELFIGSECTKDDIVFSVTNPGSKMSDEFTLSIIEDDIVLFIKTFRLNGGESQSFSFPDVGIQYKVTLRYTGSNQNNIDVTFPSCKNHALIEPLGREQSRSSGNPQMNDLPIIDIPSGILTALCFYNALIFISKNEDHLLLC